VVLIAAAGNVVGDVIVDDSEDPMTDCVVGVNYRIVMTVAEQKWTS
jgi:hypothetical protein